MLTTISSPEKAAYVRAAGADEAINYRTENVIERIADLTDGAAPTVSSNSISPPMHRCTIASWRRWHSHYLRDGAPMASVPAQAFIARGATLKWFIVYDLADADRDAGIADLNRMLATGALQTTIAARFSLTT